MLDITTINKLNEMRLTTMAKAFEEQLNNSDLNDMSFEDRFGLIVDTEWSRRKNNHLARLIKNAGLLESNACIENIRYDADRKLYKSLIMKLSTCYYIQDKRNIIILGATGAGNQFFYKN